MPSKKRKLNLKLKKSTWRKLWRDPRFLSGLGTVLIILGFGLGMVAMHFKPYDFHPDNVVYAADNSIGLPKDLVAFLRDQNSCQAYRGSGSPTGVGVWGVYQVSHNRFAKISYGCSTNLSTYIMAVKRDKKWQLVPPTEYFSTTGFLPKCTQIDKYQIDKSIEPYCIKEDGQARSNAITL